MKLLDYSKQNSGSTNFPTTVARQRLNYFLSF